MPDEIARMAAAFGLVAAAAAGVAGVSWLIARGRICLPFRRRSSPLGFVDVGLLLAVSLFAPALWAMLLRPPGDDPEERFRVMAFAQAAALPTLLAAWFVVRRVAGGAVVIPRPRLAAELFAGVAGWAVITPVTFAAYYAAIGALSAAGGVADEHPLKQVGPGRELGRVVAFFLSACLLPAVYEELVFRRVVLPWAVGPRYRPWVVVAGGVGLVLVSSREVRWPALEFAVALAAGLAAVAFGRKVWWRFPSRTAAGVYATAALFAVLHSAVWPTPVPLFVFGLGVGVLTVRTGSVVPAVVVHTLFNAVSAVYLLFG